MKFNSDLTSQHFLNRHLRYTLIHSSLILSLDSEVYFQGFNILMDEYPKCTIQVKLQNQKDCTTDGYNIFSDQHPWFTAKPTYSKVLVYLNKSPILSSNGLISHLQKEDNGIVKMIIACTKPEETSREIFVHNLKKLHGEENSIKEVIFKKEKI